MRLDLEQRDWVPTPHGVFMAHTLAERNLVEGRRVLELGAGAGNHTIIFVRQGAESVLATEISEELLATTRRNVERNCPGASNVEYRVADWLDTQGTFDVVASNPPFCKSGRRNRRYFIDSLILDAHLRLVPEGTLVFVQSSMADLDKSLRRLAENGYEARVLASTEGPFRDYYFEDPTFMEEIRHVPNGYQVRDGVYVETLYVVLAKLRPWTPQGGAQASR